MPSAKPYRVVLDTNVLASALRSRRGASFRLLQLLDDPRWQLHLSTALLLEYEEVAKRTVAHLWAKPEKIDDLLDYLCACGTPTRITYTWRPVLSDPDDDMILELAVAAQADFIVTFNTTDFRGAERFGIGILTPRELLQKIGELK